MDRPTSYLLGCIVCLLSIIAASMLFHNQSLGGSIPSTNFIIPFAPVLKHVSAMIAVSDSASSYDVGRTGSREYIKNTLVSGGFPQDNIVFQYFEWKEKQEGSYLLWSGVNILVWINKTHVPNRKIRAFGSHYDTLFWGQNSTAGASTLAGAAMLMEAAVTLFKFQEEQKRLNDSLEEIPYLFIFFDHHEPGVLGSKALSRQLDVTQMAYFISIGSLGFQGSHPILQTYPYYHRQIEYTPDWLSSLILRAGMARNVPIKIGGTTKGRSLLYQAYRYHWHAVTMLGGEGPFAWRGVPSALLTDFDAIFETYTHHLQPTDQLSTLSNVRVSEFAKILSSFIMASKTDSMLSSGIASGFYSNIVGINQYIAVGAVVVGFVELASLSMVIISVVLFNSAYQYSKVYTTENLIPDDKSTESEAESGSESDDTTNEKLPFENEAGIWQGHKILIGHMVLMSVVVIVDTVFAFEMLLFSFLALSTIHFDRFNFNILTGFICSILCVNFLYKDVIIMGKFGVRTHDWRELKTAALLFVYALHCGLLLVYGYDYRRKKAKVKEFNSK